MNQQVIRDDNWIDRAPAFLRALEGPRGEECTTTIDRRWLWRLAAALSFTAGDSQLVHDLRTYLHQSCDHHWRYDEADDCPCPALRQCVWCTWVDLIDEHGAVIPEQGPDQK